jgi:hypothetical protein
MINKPETDIPDTSESTNNSSTTVAVTATIYESHTIRPNTLWVLCP